LPTIQQPDLRIGFHTPLLWQNLCSARTASTNNFPRQAARNRLPKQGRRRSTRPLDRSSKPPRQRLAIRAM
jgi:hypothetical protein